MHAAASDGITLLNMEYWVFAPLAKHLPPRVTDVIQLSFRVILRQADVYH